MRSSVGLIAVIILLPVFLPGCSKEAERDFARVRTYPVTGISDNGVVMKGEILNSGSVQIDDHGFIFGKGSMVNDDEPYYISLGNENIRQSFEYNLTKGLEDEQTYYCLAYALANEVLTLGDEVQFKSQGSMPPVIDSFFPSEGQVGDHISIFVSNITFDAEQYTVKFKDIVAEKLSFSDSVINVSVPLSLVEKSSIISISGYGLTGYSNTMFELTEPEIDDFEPKIAVPGDELTIYGTNFHSNKSFNEVFIGESPAYVYESSDTTLRIQVPATGDSMNQIKVTISGQSCLSSELLKIEQPLITYFSPTNGSIGNSIHIYGSGLNVSELQDIRIGNIPATVLFTSDHEIIFEVPAGLTQCESQIELIYNELIKITIKDYFVLDRPVITGFSQTELMAGSGLSIYGENFNPRASANTVILGSTKITPVSASETELVIVIPDYTSGTYTPGIRYCDEIIYSETSIKVIPVQIWTQVADFPGGEAYKVSSFAINGYGYAGLGTRLHHDYIDKFWKYDPAADSWTEIAPFPGETRVVAYGFTLDNRGYIGAGFNMDSPNRTVLNDYYSYNPGTNSWSHLTNYPGTTDINILGSCNAVENKVYVSQYDFYKLSVEPTKWTKINSNSEDNIYSCTGSFVIDDIIYYVCGIDVSTTPYETKSTVWSFNTNTGIWEEKNPFPGDSRYTGIGFSLNGKGYFGLGHNLDNYYYKDIWQYDPDADSWTLYDYLPGVARSCAFVFTIDNFAYIGTGANYSGTLLKDIYRFNPLD